MRSTNAARSAGDHDPGAFRVFLREDPGADPRLRGWRHNAGGPVALDAPAPPDPGRVLAVLSWNVWIGRGRLREVLARFRDGGFARMGAPADAALVVLLQEAYREDGSVPANGSAWAPRDPPRDFRPQEDVVDVARELGLSLRYAPSMRNGTHRSDRGNAVLASVPIEDAFAFELPFVLQRRVAVAAVVSVPGGSGPLRMRVASAHLDPWGALGWDWTGAAGRAVQARALLDGLAGLDGEGDATTEPDGRDVRTAPERRPAGTAAEDRDAGRAASGHPVRATVLGADLNTTRGRREPAYRLLTDAGFTVGLPHREPHWGHTYHMVPRLPIDHLLMRREGRAAAAAASRAGAAPRIAGAAVHRLNENPRDAGPTVFGSDHHPLLGTLDLAWREEAP
jgi:endonuclease/exonuclease/phosphatase family metal-dependent hydrolase